LVLAGLGIYLVRGHRSGGGTPAAAPSTSAAAQPSASTPSAGVPPSAVPAASPVSTAGGAEIYQWLPFTPAQLAAAVQTTTTFAKDYATWSYTESPTAYAAKMAGLVAAQELAIIKEGYSTSGVAGPRAADKQVSAGAGTINSIRTFGSAPNSPVSITFLVTISQQVTSTQPAKTASTQYAITVVSSGGGWQVNDMELSSLGNTGN